MFSFNICNSLIEIESCYSSIVIVLSFITYSVNGVNSQLNCVNYYFVVQPNEIVSNDQVWLLKDRLQYDLIPAEYCWFGLEIAFLTFQYWWSRKIWHIFPLCKFVSLAQLVCLLSRALGKLVSWSARALVVERQEVPCQCAMYQYCDNKNIM